MKSGKYMKVNWKQIKRQLETLDLKVYLAVYKYGQG
jgi:hypothetical protein